MRGWCGIALKKIENLKPGNPDIPPNQVFSTAGPHYDKLKKRDMGELERVWLPEYLVEVYKKKLEEWGLPMKRHVLERVHSLFEAGLEGCLDTARSRKERMKILLEETCLEEIKQWKDISCSSGRFSVNGKRPFVYLIYYPERYSYRTPGIYIMPERNEDLDKMPDYTCSYDVGMAFAYWRAYNGMVELSVVQSDIYSHIPAGIRKHYRHWPDAIFGIAAILAKELNEKYVGVFPAYKLLDIWPRLSVSIAHSIYSYKPSKYFELDECGLWVADADKIIERMKKQEPAPICL